MSPLQNRDLFLWHAFEWSFSVTLLIGKLWEWFLLTVRTQLNMKSYLSIRKLIYRAYAKEQTLFRVHLEDIVNDISLCGT